MKISVMIAVNDSMSSRSLINSFANMPFRRSELEISLVHVFRKTSAEKELLGQDFSRDQLQKFKEILNDIKTKLIVFGFNPEQIQIKLIKKTYLTVADGLIDQFKSRDYQMIIIGRKRMSKAEEFIMGDPSIKLVRSLENVSILVIK